MGVIYQDERCFGKDVTMQRVPRVLGLTKKETIEFHTFITEHPSPSFRVCPICNQIFGIGENGILIYCADEEGQEELRLVHDHERLPKDMILLGIYTGSTSEEDIRNFKEVLAENIADYKREHAGGNGHREEFRKRRREHSAPRKQLPVRVPIGSR